MLLSLQSYPVVYNSMNSNTKLHQNPIYDYWEKKERKGKVKQNNKKNHKHNT